MTRSSMTGVEQGGSARGDEGGLTPLGHSTLDDQLTPLAGSASELVYARQEHLARDGNVSAATVPGYASGPTRLYARSDAGKVRYVGMAPSAAGVGLDGWSTFGNVLAVGERGDEVTPRNPVVVWSLSSGHRRVVMLHGRDSFLAAAPGGIAYAGPGGTLRIRRLSGHVTSLGAPFGGDSSAPLEYGAAGPDGIVVGSDGRIAYVPWSDPSKTVQLDDPENPNLAVACQGVSATYAVCGETPFGDTSVTDDAFLVPFDGGAATLADLSGCDFAGAALDGNAMVSACSKLDDPPFSPAKLIEQRSGSSATTVLSSKTSADLASAYGEAVAAGHNGERLWLVPHSAAVSVLVKPRASPVTVDSFALSAHRVVYSDDQRVASRPGLTESVFERSATMRHGTVHAAPATLLSRGHSTVTGNLVGASDTVRAYVTVTSAVKGPPVQTLHVRSPHKTFEATVSGSLVEVSGRRVLYASGHSSVAVLNTTTGTTKHVTGVHLGSAALAGEHLVYAGRYGAVIRENIRTGQKVTVAPKIRGDNGGDYVAVYEAGDWVGWNIQPLGAQPATLISKIRDARTMTKTITLPHTLYALSDAGALEDSTTASFSGPSQAGLITGPTRFWLRSYTGHTRNLLAKRRYLTGPEIAGHLLAWAGANGQLQLTTVPGP